MIQLQAENPQQEKIVKLYIWNYHTNGESLSTNLNYSVLFQSCFKKRVVDWNNEILNSPGESIMYSTIIQYHILTVIDKYMVIWVKMCPKYKKINRTTN